MERGSIFSHLYLPTQWSVYFCSYNSDKEKLREIIHSDHYSKKLLDNMVVEFSGNSWVCSPFLFGMLEFATIPPSAIDASMAIKFPSAYHRSPTPWFSPQLLRVSFIETITFLFTIPFPIAPPQMTFLILFRIKALQSFRFLIVSSSLLCCLKQFWSSGRFNKTEYKKNSFHSLPPKCSKIK